MRKNFDENNSQIMYRSFGVNRSFSITKNEYKEYKK